MKRLLLALAVAVVIAPAAFAGTLTVQNAAGSPGGLFIANTSDHGSFGTFCLEYNEHISFGPTYYYEVSSGAINGGISGGNPDPISRATAFLFVNYQSWVGFPGGYNPANAAHNNAIQNVIWFLEGEVAALDAGLATNLYNDLIGIVTNPFDDANGYLGVQVMNIYENGATGAQGEKKQDLLVRVIPRVPDGGLTVILLGLAVGCLALLSRRLGS